MAIFVNMKKSHYADDRTGRQQVDNSGLVIEGQLRYNFIQEVFFTDSFLVTLLKR